jgi:cell division protein FtsZ
MEEITNYVLDKTNGTADIIWGAGPDENLGDELKVIHIATGFEKSGNSTANVYQLPEEKKEEPKIETPKAIENTDEIRIITKTPESEVKEEAPKAAVEQKAEKRVFVLEPEPMEEPVHEVRNIRSNSNEPFPTEIDVMVDNIHLEHKEAVKPAPVQTLVEEPVAVAEPIVMEPVQQVQPVQSPAHSAFANDNDAMTAAERIRKIHEMLRYDPAGPDKVQSMTSRQIAGESFAELGSAIHEESAYTVSKNGIMTSKPSLHANVD